MQEGQGGVTRRQVLAGAAAGAAQAGFGGPVLAQAPGPRGAIVDFHHHFTAPFISGNTPNEWVIDKSIEAMDRAGVTKAILSPATGFAESFMPAQVPPVTRRVNEYAAEQARDHPGRYGQFVYVPLPDVDAALAEIAYGFDVLKAQGALLVTSYGETYVSDPGFEPVWQELNRRGAIAYFHPRAGACCEKLFPEFDAERNWIEIPYDTGRAIVTFLLRGTFARYRNIKWVFSHSGAAMPALSGRIHNLSARADLHEAAPDGILAELKRLHYETANGGARPSMAALLALVPVTQVLFGTDYPYVSIADNLADLESNHFPPEILEAILRGNAARLLPGFA
jgi:predicted TIM-barrel fold metal-dependent hydrolase